MTAVFPKRKRGICQEMLQPPHYKKFGIQKDKSLITLKKEIVFLRE